MATKSKPAAKKPAARKPVVHKPAAAAHKSAIPKKKIEPAHKPAAHPPSKPQSHSAPPPKPATKPAHRPATETVSLIDKKHPEKKPVDGETKKKTTVLPPISRIRASLEASTAPPPKKAEPTPAPPVPETPTTEVAAAEPEAQDDGKQVIHIKPPIIVKQLATELGVKPHQLIAELMTFNIFANINQTIEPDIASKIAESHGF